MTEQALKDAEMDKHDVDAVAATCAPGLIGALLVGANFGKSLAFAMNKPFIPVHHIRGHIAATYLAYPELKPPFLTLIASGGHSEIVMVKSYTEFEILGGTRDDAAGEAFDKVARVLGVGYPGGPKIDKLAQDGDAKMYKLPDSHIKDAPLDFSFSGLKTAVINLAHNAEQKGETIDRNGLAASFCAAVGAYARPAARRWPSSRRMRGALSARAAWQPTPSCGRPCRTWQSASTSSCLCRRCSCAVITPP